MRLRDIQIILKDLEKGFVLTKKNMNNDSLNLRIENVNDFVMYILRIKEANIFKTEMEEILSYETLIHARGNSAIFNIKDVNRLFKIIQSLKEKLVIFREGMSTILPEQDSLSLSIKLPKINDLKELKTTSEQLDKLLEQLILYKPINGVVKLQNFDTGSEWVEIFLGTKLALWVISSVANLIIRIKRESILNNSYEEDLKNKRITNKTYELIIKDISENKKNMIDNEIDNICKKANIKKDDSEYKEILKYGIKEMTDLFDKGMKLFPSEKCPEDIKKTLPDFSKKNLLDMLPDQKILEEKNNK